MLFTGETLLALDFDPVVDELVRLCALVDSGECSPQCLFGTETGACQCRCGGIHHSEMRQ